MCLLPKIKSRYKRSPNSRDFRSLSSCSWFNWICNIKTTQYRYATIDYWLTDVLHQTNLSHEGRDSGNRSTETHYDDFVVYEGTNHNGQNIG